MKKSKLLFLSTCALALLSAVSQGATLLVNDPFTATSSTTGFGLNNGINFGINPPTSTRMTGTVATNANLRYVKTGNKGDSAYSITSNKGNITTGSQTGRFTISADGSTAYDFSPVLGISSSTPANPALYDITIALNNKGTTGKMSFGFGTQEAGAGSWNFGLQLYKSGGLYYVNKNIKIGASGLGATQAANILTNTATATEISFFIRVTDAGAETTTYNSRIQVSTNGGTSWIYDSQTDPDLINGIHFEAGTRYCSFDQAINDGADTYDNFSITLNSTFTNSLPKLWSGAGANDFWTTPENWGGTAPINNDQLTFAGTTRQTNIDDITDLVASAITFSNGGFSLGGNALYISGPVTNLAGTNIFASDLGYSNTVGKSWVIASGSEIVLNNTNNVGTIGDFTINGGGNLRLKGVVNIGQTNTANPAYIVNEGKHIIDGGTFTSIGGYRLGSNPSGAGAQTILTNNASLTLTTSAGNFRVGDSANPNTTRLLIDNSTLTMTKGVLGVPYTAGATSVVSQVGGKVAGCILSFNENGAGKGTYTISNGVLEVYMIRTNNGGGTGTITFDNATLRPSSGASNDFFKGVNSAQITSGGLVVDGTSDITIAQVLKGTGFLIKSNGSTVTLTGANTYSGNTVVQGGKLVLPTSQSTPGTILVGDGTELGVLARSTNSTLTAGSLNFAAPSFSTMTFDLASFANPTQPLVRATNLTVSGPVTINVINGLQWSIGQFVLVKYDGSINGGFQFTLNNLPAGVSATLVDNSANSSIDLNITGVPGLSWTGTNNNSWDDGSLNWIDKQTGLPAAYSDGEPLDFLDTAVTGNVSIGGFPIPSVIVVSNNTLPYSWTGGGITTPLIKKYGTNSLTRIESAPDLVAGVELNQGSFIITNTGTTTFTTTLTDTAPGTGTLVIQEGNTSTFTINSNNKTFDGTINIQSGTLKLGSTNALGNALSTTTGRTVISSGATLDLNNNTPGTEPVTVSGAGADGNGAITDTTAATGVSYKLRDVTMVGDTTFGSPNGGRWDLRINSGTPVSSGLKGNGFNLTKVGSGFVSIACQRSLGTNTPYWDMNLGDVVVNGGTLVFAESLTLGNPSKNITVNSGAILQFYDLNATNPVWRTIYFNDGKLNGGGGSTDTNVLNGAISITGNLSVKPDQCAIIINGPITNTGSLSLSANDPGRVYLNGANTYPGDTVVTNGTLGGTGSLAGSLIMLGGTNAPGRLDAIGTFTVNGNVTLGGNTLIELNRNQSPNSDRLAAGGTLTFGGTLTVILGAGAPAPQATDVYQIFNKGGSGSFTTIKLPTLSSTNLAWNTANLSVDGTISVTGPAPRPTISQSTVSGTNFVFSGIGTEGASYRVVTSTNVAAPIGTWTPVSTNVFGPGGVYSVTNAIDPSQPQSFYQLIVP